MFPKLEICATGSGKVICRRWTDENVQAQGCFTVAEALVNLRAFWPCVHIDRLEVCDAAA